MFASLKTRLKRDPFSKIMLASFQKQNWRHAHFLLNNRYGF